MDLNVGHEKRAVSRSGSPHLPWPSLLSLPVPQPRAYGATTQLLNLLAASSDLVPGLWSHLVLLC